VIHTPSTLPQRTIHARTAKALTTPGYASHLLQQLALVRRTT